MQTENNGKAFAERIVADGFEVVPSVISEREVTSIAAKLENSTIPRSRAGIRHILRDAEAAAFARDSRLLGLASAVLGSDAFPFRATLFDKSQTANWLVVWHQDTALPLKERHEVSDWGPWSVKDGVNYAHAPTRALEKVLALRIHLDDSTLENGPLRVLPGTHTRGVLSDDQIRELSSTVGAVNCILSRGGVLAMRPLIVHASSKSQSAAPRRVLHIEYAATLQIEDRLQLAIA